jgi:hypothetical protein
MNASSIKSITTVIFLFGVCQVIKGQGNSNYIAIRNANIQIKSSLNNTPMAWTTDVIDIKLNKQTGDFEAQILVDNLTYATPNADFTGATGENKGKYLSLTGVLPVSDVLENTNNAIDRKVEITTAFNNLEHRSTFTFTILKFQTGGFSVMASGTVSHRELEITNLDQLNDELVILLSFTGY